MLAHFPARTQKNEHAQNFPGTDTLSHPRPHLPTLQNRQLVTANVNYQITFTPSGLPDVRPHMGSKATTTISIDDPVTGEHFSMTQSGV